MQSDRCTSAQFLELIFLSPESFSGCMTFRLEKKEYRVLSSYRSPVQLTLLVIVVTEITWPALRGVTAVAFWGPPGTLSGPPESGHHIEKPMSAPV